MTDKDPIVNLRLFRHRNFSCGHRGDGAGVCGVLQRRHPGAAVAAAQPRVHGDLGGLRHGADRHPAGDADALRGQVRAQVRPAHAGDLRVHRAVADEFRARRLQPRRRLQPHRDDAAVAGFRRGVVLHAGAADPAVGPAAARDRGGLGAGDVHANAGRQLRRVADDVRVDRTRRGAPRAHHGKAVGLRPGDDRSSRRAWATATCNAVRRCSNA